jgi:hypothetical protein
MQIRIGNPSTASTESPPEDIIVLVDSAEVASEYSMRSARRCGPSAWRCLCRVQVRGNSASHRQFCASPCHRPTCAAPSRIRRSVRMTEYLIASRAAIIFWTSLAVVPAEILFDAIETEL